MKIVGMKSDNFIPVWMKVFLTQHGNGRSRTAAVRAAPPGPRQECSSRGAIVTTASRVTTTFKDSHTPS